MKFEEVLRVVIDFFGPIHPDEADALRAGLTENCVVIALEFVEKIRCIEFVFTEDKVAANWPTCLQTQQIQYKLREAIPARVLYERDSDDVLEVRALLVRQSFSAPTNVKILPRKQIDSLVQIPSRQARPSRGLAAFVKQRTRLR